MGGAAVAGDGAVRRLALLGCALAIGAGACSYFGGEQTQPFTPPLEEPTGADVGERLYLRDCAWCHGAGGDGTGNGPDLVSGQNGDALTDFMLRTGRMPVARPDQPSVHGEPHYDESQIAAIVDHVTSLDAVPGPPIPTPEPEQANLSLGLELYLENCAACHSTTGVGGALTSQQAEDDGPSLVGSDLVAPGLHNSTALEIAEAMVAGPGNMPVFGEETISPSQRDAIVRYVLYLQDPSDRGGAPTGRSGPVVEGAIAWLVTIGALVLVIRWIGTKAEDT